MVRLVAEGSQPRRWLYGRAWAALIAAAVIAVSPLFSGYYDTGQWEPLALGALLLTVILGWVARPALTRAGVSAACGMVILLGLSAASILWSESRDSSWTSTNQLALYVLVFIIGVLGVRDRQAGRAVLFVLGMPAALSSLVLTVEFLFGSGQGAFLTSRLDSPIGYINGTAGLLAMGIWPWLGFAESTRSRFASAACLALASLTAGTAVLTQSRAIIPATVLAAICVLIAAPDRTRRALILIVAIGSVAVSLPWTLAIYTSHGLVGSSAPPASGALRDAGVALLAGALLAAFVWLVGQQGWGRVPLARRPGIHRMTGRGLTTAAIIVVVAGAGLGRHTISAQWKAFTSEQVTSSTSTTRFLEAGGFRKDLWRVALDEFKAHPIGGVGAGDYDADYYRLRRNPEYVVVPHSLELQMAAELGVGGIIGIALLICGVLACGFARRGTLAAEDPAIRVGALGLFVAWLAATSVDWLYDIPGLAGAAFLAAALLAVRSRTTDESRSRTRRGQLLLLLGFVLLALVAASIGRQYAASRYLAAGTGQVSRTPVQALHTLQQAESLDPYSLPTLYAISSAYAQLDDYAGARAAIARAEQLEPDNYVPPALLGDLAHRAGLYTQAVHDYTHALHLNPLAAPLQENIDQNRALAR